MKQFFARAWANPVTTFTGLGAVVTLVTAEFANAPPAVTHTLHVVGGVLAILLAMASKDAEERAS